MHNLRPPGRLQRALAVTALVVACLLIAVPAVHAATRHDTYPLHPGSHGQRVKDLQWLLGGHRPNAFTKIAPTFKHNPNGSYGARTKSAVKAYKYRLGYPARLLNDTVGLHFIYMLEGKAHRPAAWVALAASRVTDVQPAKPTALGLAIEKVEQGQLGVTEIGGNNRGAEVDRYSLFFHLPLGLSYCVIFQQWSFAQAGYRPPFADSTWSAYAVADFYAARNMLFAKPKLFAIVVFVDYANGQRIPGTGHVGYVIRVTASGYYTIEGNTGYGADAGVRERFHGFHDRGNVFAYVTGVTS